MFPARLWVGTRFTDIWDNGLDARVFFETHMLTFSFFENLMPKRSRARIHIFVFFCFIL